MVPVSIQMIKSFIFIIALLLSLFNAAEGVSIRSQVSSTSSMVTSGICNVATNSQDGTIVNEGCATTAYYDNTNGYVLSLKYLPTAYLWYNSFFVVEFTQTNQWAIGIANLSDNSYGFSSSLGGNVPTVGVSQTIYTSAFTTIGGTYLWPLANVFPNCVMSTSVECANDSGTWYTKGGVYFPALAISSNACGGAFTGSENYFGTPGSCPSGMA